MVFLIVPLEPDKFVELDPAPLLSYTHKSRLVSVPCSIYMYCVDAVAVKVNHC